MVARSKRVGGVYSFGNFTEVAYNLGYGINWTDHPVSEIETRTEALAFDSFTETIRETIRETIPCDDQKIIQSVCRISGIQKTQSIPCGNEYTAHLSCN